MSKSMINLSIPELVAKLPVIVSGKKVLVQLSGGKDSVACLIMLAKSGVQVEAIHFDHDYGYALPKDISESVCSKYGVKHTSINLTAQIEELFLNGFNLRPCRFCKSVMDQCTIDYAINNGIELVCVGDTGDDTMLINRINGSGDDYMVSDYFNKRVSLPDGIRVIRPLIYNNSSEILSFVKENFPSFRRINDTGDKYFEYSREGCPLQFKDLGAFYTRELMKDLQTANTLCSGFATERGIKASVHLPSGFIVTIPKGYEAECREYLEKRGFVFPSEDVKTTSCLEYTLTVSLYQNLFDSEVMKVALLRLAERLRLPVPEISMSGNVFSIESKRNSGEAIVLKNQCKLVVHLYLETPIDTASLENIIMEIFHTYDFSVYCRTI